jgi:hypothetical protein
VASIAEVPLPLAIAVVGHSKGTKAIELRKALSKFGVTLGPTRLTRYEEIPSKAVLRLSRPHGRNWHWMLQWDGVVHDPSPINTYPTLAPLGWEITSFMEVKA